MIARERRPRTTPTCPTPVTLSAPRRVISSASSAPVAQPTSSVRMRGPTRARSAQSGRKQPGPATHETIVGSRSRREHRATLRSEPEDRPRRGSGSAAGTAQARTAGSAERRPSRPPPRVAAPPQRDERVCGGRCLGGRSDRRCDVRRDATASRINARSASTTSPQDPTAQPSAASRMAAGLGPWWACRPARAWLVRARAPSWRTTGRRSPLMTWRTSFMSARPRPAVKVGLRDGSTQQRLTGRLAPGRRHRCRR